MSIENRIGDVFESWDSTLETLERRVISAVHAERVAARRNFIEAVERWGHDHGVDVADLVRQLKRAKL